MPSPSATVVNALTIDTEEWFHICGVDALAPDRWAEFPSRIELTTKLLLDDMNACGIRATFLVVGWLADRYPRLIEEILSAGHEVGSHGYLHRRVYELTPEAFEEDLRRSVRALEDAGVTRVRCFRAPEWSINERSMWALDSLAASGLEIDASMAPVKIVGSETFPRTPHIRSTRAGRILEMPPLVADRFGYAMPLWGWGLRMSTPRAVCGEIERLNGMAIPAVLTVHPWEIDPEPPIVSLPWRLWFAHYFRLGGFRSRLREVMRLAPFGMLSDVAVGIASII